MKFLSSLFVMAALAVSAPGFANPAAEQALARLTTQERAQLLAEVLTEVQAGRSAQQAIVRRLQASVGPEAAQLAWSSNVLMVGGLQAFQNYAEGLKAAGQLNADDLVRFLSNEKFESKADPMQVALSMMSSKTPISRATFETAMAKAETQSTAAAAAPKAEVPADDPLLLYSVQVPDIASVAESVILSGVRKAVLGAEAAEDFIEAVQAKFREQVPALIAQLTGPDVMLDPTLETKAARLRQVLGAVKAQGCPIDQSDMGKVSSACQSMLVGTYAWAVDEVIKGLESEAKTNVALDVMLQGMGHTDPQAVRDGFAKIFADALVTPARHERPENEKQTCCVNAKADCYGQAG